MPRPLCLLVAAAILVLAPEASARTWTDNRGNQVVAKFVRVHQGDVVLLRGGRALKVPFENLSQEDQEYIRKELEAKGQGHLVPATSGWSVGARTGRPGVGRLDGPTGGEDGDPDEGWEGDQDREEGPGGPEPERTWTDTRGRTIEARFVGMSGNNVLLLKEGRQISVPLAAVSPQDQQYVRAAVAARGAGGSAPGGAGPRSRSPHASGPPPGYASRMPPGYAEYGEEESEDQEEMMEHEESEEYSEYGPPEDMDEQQRSGRGPGSSGYRGGSSAGYGSQSGYGGGSSGRSGFPGPRSPRGPGGPPPSYPSSDYGESSSEESYAGGADSQIVYYCTGCKKEVPAHLKAGDKCPHCGITFEYEQTADGKWVDKGGREVSPWLVKIGGTGGIVTVVVIVIGLLVRLAASRD